MIVQSKYCYEFLKCIRGVMTMVCCFGYFNKSGSGWLNCAEKTKGCCSLLLICVCVFLCVFVFQRLGQKYKDHFHRSLFLGFECLLEAKERILWGFILWQTCTSSPIYTPQEMWSIPLWKWFSESFWSEDIDLALGRLLWGLLTQIIN